MNPRCLEKSKNEFQSLSSHHNTVYVSAIVWTFFYAELVKYVRQFVDINYTNVTQEPPKPVLGNALKDLAYMK